MPALAYNDTPQATDPINQTQAPIRTNFQNIRALLGVNHVDFADADNGKHKFVTFPVQGAAPVFLAGEVGLYNKAAVAPFGTFNELFIHKLTTAGTATADIPFTASILSTSNPLPVSGANGWTYLPSGIIMQWGSFGVNDTSNEFGVNAFPIAFPNQCLQVTVSAFNSGNVTAVPIIFVQSFTQAGFTLATRSGNSGNTSSCRYIAIGY